MPRVRPYDPRLEKLRDVRRRKWKPFNHEMTETRRDWVRLRRRRQEQYVRIAGYYEDLWDFDLIEPRHTCGWLTW